MFYDLNIQLPDSAGKPGGHISSQDWAQIAQALEQARHFGYETVALNQVVHGKLTPAHLKVWSTIPQLPFAHYTWEATTGNRLTSKPKRGQLQVLRRLTNVLSEGAHGHALTSNGNPSVLDYDLVAVRPENEKILFAACNGSWDSVDIISLDMAVRWGFFAKHKTIGLALQHQYALEISYGEALADSASRRQWVSNASSIVRVTKGRNVLWTSAASRPFGLRAPYDIVNLGGILQLNGDLSKRAMTSNARAAVMHGYTRRETLRAVAAVEEAVEDMAEEEEAEPQRKKQKVAA
ncbi:RNA-binding RNA processing protein rpp1 [Linderina macrospora]|uniref:RNA-binding RNA processing protein rpp1 n=1 Tax=Linderina macrospora TaxID=4868 RepID=A0ACC1JGB1_9FUNG|nr:RNA-binding RNA processing protein rpp1 [Linderina macrospora]